MRPIRVAVVGSGHLGKIHAKLASGLEGFELAAVVDPLETAGAAVAEQYGVPHYGNVSEILGRVDAAVVATPTQSHCEVAAQLLAADIHVLVEKPITLSLDEADDLIALAEQAGRVLQVGHVERFNPAFRAAQSHIDRPRYIEATRQSGYTFRSIDVGVTLDLMIHDIDLILSLTASPVVDVQALGLTVFGPHEDIVQARLQFQNGCVANLTASRASFEPSRKMRIFSDSGFVGVDFAERKLQCIAAHQSLAGGVQKVHRMADDEKAQVRDGLFETVLPLQQAEIPATNAIEDELCEFATCIHRGEVPTVDGHAGREALAVALRVVEQIERHQWHDEDQTIVGPRLTATPWHLEAAEENTTRRAA